MNDSMEKVISELITDDATRQVVLKTIQNIGSGEYSQLANNNFAGNDELMAHIKKMINMHKTIKRIKKKVMTGAGGGEGGGMPAMDEKTKELVGNIIQGVQEGKYNEFTNFKDKYDPELAAYIQQMIKLHVNIKKIKKQVMETIAQKQN